MCQDIKGDHFKLLKDADQSVENFIIEGIGYTDTKIGESGFTRDMFHADTGLRPVGLRAYAPEGIGAISPTSILVPEDLKEMAHILMTVDMTKKVEEEQAWRVITRRSIR
jgi:hypothetical protein